MMSPSQTTGPRKAALTFILITITLDMLALGIMAPVFPRLIIEFLGGDTARAAAISGLFATVFAAMQLLFSPLIGMLSDRFGRRPVILISNFGLGIDYIVMALAPSLGWLFVGRMISGITTSTIATAYAYITDVTPPEKRAGAFGMIGAAFGIGFVFGPALGGLLGNHDPRLPFWVAAAFSLLNWLYGFFVLPESLAPEKRATTFAWERANPFGALKLLRRHRELFGLATVNCLYYIAHEALPNVFVFYVIYRYGWTSATVGLTLAMVGISQVVVSGALIKPIVARLGERRALVAGLLFGAAGFLVFAFAVIGPVYWLGVPLVAMWALASASVQGLMTRHVTESEQGQLQGAISSVRSIASLIGPGLFTSVLAYFIGPRSDWHLPGAPWILAALMVLSAATLAWIVTRAEPDAAVNYGTSIAR